MFKGTSTIILPITTLEVESLICLLQEDVEEARDHGIILRRIPSFDSAGTHPIVMFQIKPTQEEYDKLLGRPSEKKKELLMENEKGIFCVMRIGAGYCEDGSNGCMFMSFRVAEKHTPLEVVDIIAELLYDFCGKDLNKVRDFLWSAIGDTVDGFMGGNPDVNDRLEQTTINTFNTWEADADEDMLLIEVDGFDHYMNYKFGEENSHYESLKASIDYARMKVPHFESVEFRKEENG